MYDAVYNLIANDGYNDYTNAVSTALEKAQDSIRERFAIYQENPGKSFDIGDLDGGLIMLLLLHLHYLCLFHLRVS